MNRREFFKKGFWGGLGILGFGLVKSQKPTETVDEDLLIDAMGTLRPEVGDTQWQFQGTEMTEKLGFGPTAVVVSVYDGKRWTNILR